MSYKINLYKTECYIKKQITVQYMLLHYFELLINLRNYMLYFYYEIYKFYYDYIRFNY
ncbi:MAG: hypothetical protein Q607_CBUC00054G0015 [Clostridium butyricum DORA_1]|nr:MAG: hypothetical protein Q607_CBUC00054G0015 [Clostridium butyricum DORA_1]